MAANSLGLGAFHGRKTDIYKKTDEHRQTVNQNFSDINIDIDEIESFRQSVTTIRAYIENTCIMKHKHILNSYIGETYKLLQDIDTKIKILIRHKKFEIDPEMRKVHLTDLKADDVKKMLANISKNIEQIKPTAFPPVASVNLHVTEQVSMAMQRLYNRAEGLRIKMFVRENNSFTVQN